MLRPIFTDHDVSLTPNVMSEQAVRWILHEACLMFNWWRDVLCVCAVCETVIVLTCVYPQVDFEMVGGAERLPTIGTILGGRGQISLAVLGQRRLDAPRCLRQVLPNIWSTCRDSTRRRETNGRCVKCHSKPPPSHHITTLFFFSFFSFSFFLFCLSLFVPPRFLLLKFAQMCKRHTKSNTSNGFTAALFSSLTERWQFISFSLSLETPQSWDTPPPF